MLHYYYHPILGFQWFGASPLSDVYSKKRKKDGKERAPRKL